MPDLLIELFSEEIPARMQSRAAADLKKLVTDGLVEAGLTYASAAAFATPRRLTLTVEGMLAQSPTTREERKGPKADAPDKAIEGFLRGAGVTRDQLEQRETPKGPVLFATIERPGRPAPDIVAEVLEQAIRGFPWPKAMRWGAGSLRWVRPLHSILCIMVGDDGAEVVPLEVDGIASGDTTRGHRFLSPDAFSVTGFDDYCARLKRAHVVLDPAERAQGIWHDATNLAFAGGLEVVEDAGLLAEVAGLVEWPVVLMGQIDDAFLGLPPEVLQTSMKEHQKFFSVRAAKTGRIERFITVANRTTADQGATILAGNQRVLSARLADAKFFWENDLRTIKAVGLEGMAAPLAEVTFHNKLGSQADRVARIAALAREIAVPVGAKPDLATEAARIAKADLASEMVYEFPELQGTMGKYYAEAAGHDDGVPQACAEHYSPLGPSDAVPTAPISVAVALADKIDTLTGFWAIDEKPTGSKDPFALRRAALGVIRLVLENDLKFEMNHFLKKSLLSAEIQRLVIHRKKEIEEAPNALLKMGTTDETLIMEVREAVEDTKIGIDQSDLLSFLHDRLKVYLREQGIRHDIIDACIAMEGSDDLSLLVKRARALDAVLRTDDGENLIQGFKRANNILSQAEAADGVEYSFGGDIKFCEAEEERALFAALDAAEARIGPAMAQQDFATAMSAMAALRGPIDAFFEAVQVNSDNGTVRRNRLNLLSSIRKICLTVADLSRIDG
ncbi:glycine--tRNA ligase subunit beta [Sulfitobacter sabulilitoris]|uniref:Glycine--tRNA ligase beta subunit n=1 Tax=Sulfitobacter sabulilitoris TaxID=2562655 RepID=A0A5S3PBE2_9RHOB|nr:glycine--tRNA ligase subunit beta [Sulfitobacter sabulilitoris]TMM50795.1 glycine--tRNA ligase subunit beta [Sulfitobacter sabulilitoris]